MSLCGSADPFPATNGPLEAFCVVHHREAFLTRRSGARPRTGLRVRISLLRQRGLKGQGSPTLRSRDLTFLGLRGGSSATLETRVSAGRGGSGVRGRRMAASSSLVEAELQCGTVSKKFFFSISVNVAKTFLLPSICDLNSGKQERGETVNFTPQVHRHSLPR